MEHTYPIIADMNNVSLVCFGTHINSSAKNTMCISSDEPTRNNKPIVRYIHAFSFPQLKGNISAMCDISKNSIKHVINSENRAQNTINLNRPISGSKNNPTCTVPAEHSQAKQAADDITNRIRTMPVGLVRCEASQCSATPHGSGVFPIL
uniref:(northern house mosquito) hypothetical protein n=1 Tax=Culex pipiens TaxID=7175 RepID=A0A8D8BTZ7_CULPI